MNGDYRAIYPSSNKDRSHNRPAVSELNPRRAINKFRSCSLYHCAHNIQRSGSKYCGLSLGIYGIAGCQEVVSIKEVLPAVAELAIGMPPIAYN